MMGSCGITEGGNTTIGETLVPPATPVVDSEQPSAFQVALEQVTLSQEPPALPSSAPTLPSSAPALAVTAEVHEITKPSAPIETKKTMEEKGENEEVSTPTANLSTPPPVIPLPPLGSLTETTTTIETTEAQGASSLPRTAPPATQVPTESLSVAPIAPSPSRELTDALTLLTPTDAMDSEELERDAFTLQPEPAQSERPTEPPRVASSPAPLTSVPTTMPLPSVTSTGPGVAVEQSSLLALPEAPLGAVRLPELPQQLIPMLRRVNEEGNQEIRVRLDPPHLGELTVLIESGREGLAVRVVAQTRETLLLLQDQRSALQEQLGRQNLSIASFTASLAGDSPGQRSLPHYYQSPSLRSQRDAAATGAELSAIALRIPLHPGGLDVHA